MNVAAFSNLLQMFSNGMNLNGAKLPMIAQPNASAPHGTNPLLNLQEQQHQASLGLNSSRGPLSSNSTTTSTYNNDPTLYATNIPVHQHQNGNAAGPMAPSVYANSASSMSNSGGGAGY